MIARDALPVEIRTSRRAVVWKRELRNGRPTKVPYQPRRPDVRAAVNDPRTWGTFADALAVVTAGRADGPGVVLGAGLVGVDLDHVRDVDTGRIDAEAAAIVRELNSYAEASPSNAGLHVLVRGTLPPGGRRRGHVEMYCTGRFFTVTGQHVPTTPRVIHERTGALHALHRRLFPPARPTVNPSSRDWGRVACDDARLLERALAARNGAKFAALWRGDRTGYPSQSEAELALCNLLTFWTQGNAARVDSLFRQSGLYRPKWDERRGSETYGALTIEKATIGGRS
jgi:primase-polymerase (primpol)-like protein